MAMMRGLILVFAVQHARRLGPKLQLRPHRATSAGGRQGQDGCDCAALRCARRSVRAAGGGARHLLEEAE
eukprot:3422404-Prymnesium_polylepis.1